MQINPTSASTAAASTASQQQAPPQQQLNDSTFMNVLVAQLQSQDPFQPMDPTTMVTQLVQFNTLDQVTQIRADIEKQASNAAAASAAAPATSSNPVTGN